MAKPKQPQEMSAETRAGILDKLGMTIAAKRKSAIEGRLNSGIEKIWEEDEEFYQGFDDANRHEFKDIKTKPTEGGRSAEPKKHKGSTLFPNITGPYVDAAAAKVADMLLPTDERNFVIEPSPVPDILDDEEGFPAVEVQPPPGAPMAGMAAMGAMLGGMGGQPPAGAMPPQGPPPPGALPQPTPAAQIMGNPAQAAQPPQSPADKLKALFAKVETIRQKAIQAAERLQKQVDDYLVECSYHTEVREVIEDASRIGTGIVKGPVPKKRKVQVWARNPQTGERELTTKTETKPVSVRRDPWNIFPDFPACGENIHDGSFMLERDYFSPKKLGDLKGGEGKAKYIDSQIDAVLAEGPKSDTEGGSKGYVQTKELTGAEIFTVWYFYGTITGEELAAAGCDECDDPQKQYPVLITMVNDRVIKAALNPLDSGEFPYDFLPWKKRPGMPWGTGVGRQGRVAQRITTAATRNLMDNAGASAKPHKVVTDAIEQNGDPWTWRVNSEINDVRGAMQFFIQPSLQAELMQIIAMGERMMELHTGLPMIILGMQGNVQETAAGRALQNNNGSTVLRRIARNFDGKITEPHIRRYHAWEMMYGEDDTLKGDFQIKARGSSALVERDLQNQQLPNLLNLSLNPAFEMSPKQTRDEYLKSMRFNPKSFDLTEEDKARAAEARKQPPPMPQVQVAQIKEQGATERKKMDLQHESQENALDRQIDQMALKIEGELGAAGLSMEERASLNDAKVTLSGLAMKLRTQKELSAVSVGQVLTPPSEPAGQAQPGMAYQQ